MQLRAFLCDKGERGRGKFMGGRGALGSDLGGRCRDRDRDEDYAPGGVRLKFSLL